MEGSEFALSHPPIVEAVLDIDCDLPDDHELSQIDDAAAAVFGTTYPSREQQMLQEYRFRTSADQGIEERHALQALRFRTADATQLVQVRKQGFSFNRLAPYGVLDDYLPEIERTWQAYVALVRPRAVRQVRLRYINKIELPLVDGAVKLEEYLALGPRLPDERGLSLAGFLNQYTAVENATGLVVNVTLTLQNAQNDKLPIIFDNAAWSNEPGAVDDWGSLLGQIARLRDLKNRVFRNTLTPKCLDLFRA
jgi:uncharacterized protein (TIGR04255 family)